MKIIKPGYGYDNNTKRFECGYCECIFEAQMEEYVYKELLNAYVCKCPCCNKKVYYYPPF